MFGTMHSSECGLRVMNACASRQRDRVRLELGGSTPTCVHSQNQPLVAAKLSSHPVEHSNQLRRVGGCGQQQQMQLGLPSKAAFRRILSASCQGRAFVLAGRQTDLVSRGRG